MFNYFPLYMNIAYFTKDWTNMYTCPVFVTAKRGDTFVVAVNVRMDPDDDDIRWILFGAALLMTDD